jgi:hypothetical protein
MKKKFYILLLAMIVSFAANAQRFEYQLGLKGGIGASFLSTNSTDVIGKDPGVCYKFGFTGIRYFGENYGFTTGFNIMGSNMGYKVADSLGVESKRSISNTYVQVPFLLKMKTETFSDKFSVIGEIGYGLNINVSNNEKGENKHSYRAICSSFILHLGVEMEVMTHSTLQLMLAYDNNFTTMMSMSSDKYTMSNMCFEIGFLF